MTTIPGGARASFAQTSTCPQTVTVVDNQPPSITCPANQTVLATSASSALVTYPAPTVTDNCPGTAAPTCTPPSGSTFPLGTTTVTCSATDASGNPSSCS